MTRFSNEANDLLKRLKRGTLRTVRSFGLSRTVAHSRWRDRRLLILCYHGISRTDEHLWRPPLFLQPSFFRRRMEAIYEGGYRVLPLAEALRRSREGSLPPKCLTLTFDDGELGFYTHAFPILQEFGFPATVYLSTYYVEKRLPVVSVFLSYVLWSGRGHRVEAELSELGRTDLDVREPEGRTRTWTAIMEAMNRNDLRSVAKDRVIRDVAHALDVDYERLRSERRLELMAPTEIEELAERGVDFQLHTHRHRTPDDRAEFLDEISANRKVIRRITGTDPEHFCYPSGRYNEQLVAWLREAGVVSATTCDPGLASPSSDPLLLPRLVDVPTLRPVEFEAWLSGIADWLPRRNV